MAPNLVVTFNCLLKINFIFFIFIEEGLRNLTKLSVFNFHIISFKSIKKKKKGKNLSKQKQLSWLSKSEA